MFVSVLLALQSGLSLAELLQVQTGVATLSVNTKITVKQGFLATVHLEGYSKSQGTMVTLSSNGALKGEVTNMTNPTGSANFNICFVNTGTFELTAKATDYAGSITLTSSYGSLVFYNLEIVIHKQPTITYQSFNVIVGIFDANNKVLNFMIPYSITLTLYPNGELFGETTITSTENPLTIPELLIGSAGTFQLKASIEGFYPLLSPKVTITSNAITKITIGIISPNIIYSNYKNKVQVTLYDAMGNTSNRNSIVSLTADYEIIGNLEVITDAGYVLFNFYTSYSGLLKLTASASGISETISIEVLPDTLILNSILPKVSYYIDCKA